MFVRPYHRPKLKERVVTYIPSSPSNPASSSKRTKASPKASLKAGLAPATNGNGTLRSVLEKACTKTGAGLSELTVLSVAVDPYRLDTDARHRDGRWIAELLNQLLAPTKQIHCRGLHYLLVSTTGLTKPNGKPYENNDEDWTWLSETAGKAARWLGYIPFERIIDKRNAPPIIHRKPRVIPAAWADAGLDIEFPDDNHTRSRAASSPGKPTSS